MFWEIDMFCTMTVINLILFGSQFQNLNPIGYEDTWVSLNSCPTAQKRRFVCILRRSWMPRCKWPCRMWGKYVFCNTQHHTTTPRKNYSGTSRWYALGDGSSRRGPVLFSPKMAPTQFVHPVAVRWRLRNVGWYSWELYVRRWPVMAPNRRRIDLVSKRKLETNVECWTWT